MPGRDAQLRPETLSASASSNEVAPVKVAGKSAVVSAGDDEGRISTRGFAVGALAHKEAVLAELGRCLVADVKGGLVGAFAGRCSHSHGARDGACSPCGMMAFLGSGTCSSGAGRVAGADRCGCGGGGGCGCGGASGTYRGTDGGEGTVSSVSMDTSRKVSLGVSLEARGAEQPAAPTCTRCTAASADDGRARGRGAAAARAALSRAATAPAASRMNAFSRAAAVAAASKASAAEGLMIRPAEGSEET